MQLPSKSKDSMCYLFLYFVNITGNFPLLKLLLGQFQ